LASVSAARRLPCTLGGNVWGATRWILFAIKLSGPLTLIALPLVALHGHLWPWAPAEGILAQYPGQTPIMIGFSHRERHSMNGSTREDSREYVLLPSALRNPTSIIVRKINDDVLTASISSYGFLEYIGWLVLGIVITWWFWLRPKYKNAA
jgi:hypothetical protein